MLNRKEVTTLLLGVLTAVGSAVAGPEHDHSGDKKGPAALPKCPVMGEPVNLAISVATDDGPAYFCCQGCVKKYKADAAKYATGLAEQRKALADRPKVQVTCPVSGKPVDGKTFIEQGDEKIFFFCPDCVAKYKKDPEKYAAALANSYTHQTTCPVMGKTIDPTSFTKLADGRTIYYCCPGCEGRLFDTPAKYAKNLVDQGFQYNWAKIKKADDKKSDDHGSGHDHDAHEGHDHNGN